MKIGPVLAAVGGALLAVGSFLPWAKIGPITIAGIKGVTMAEDVTGPYDVIVRAEARNIDEMGGMVVAKVQNVEGITRTLTCPVVHL